MDCQEEIQYELLQQNKNEFVKEEDSGVQILTVPETEAKTADTKEPKPFSARMTTRNIYYSSDSYSSDSEFDSGSDCETKVIAEEDSDVQNLTISKMEAKIADTKAPKTFSARMTTRNIHYSSDSDSDSYFSDSDSDTIAEEEYKLQKETSPKDTAIELQAQCCCS
ncbi:hypothetical protein POM88_033306 [Heracleum sosnowskyi]|uniref:Uncharacterized protein n=1 Tax=Heracleum sosnowskyi TaxID=360622 RepID=A0AAD8I3A6_9APIA|nr:hypothetical protein POM88_033306 [Heracleum sosnowskyi]